MCRPRSRMSSAHLFFVAAHALPLEEGNQSREDACQTPRGCDVECLAFLFIFCFIHFVVIFHIRALVCFCLFFPRLTRGCDRSSAEVFVPVTAPR